MNPDDDDPLAAIRAGLDQAIAGFAETARALYGHYSAHVTAGFSEGQAFRLTSDFHAAMIRGELDDGEDA
jgi:hypothetical protein